MARIVFINRFYRPDHSATAQLLTDLAEELARHALTVSVVTSRQLYLDSHATLPTQEQLGAVEIHRIWTSRFGRNFLPGRLIDYLSFYLNALVQLLRVLKRGDVLVVKTDPPLLSIIGAIAARLKGAVLINWLQDVFPEVASELGVRFDRRIYDLLEMLRNRSLRSARCNIVLGNAMARHLDRCGVPIQKIQVIHNWVLDTAIEPIDPMHNSLREEWKLHDKFVTAYSGNLGRAHDYRTILGAAAQLRNDSDFVFLFVGSGAGLAELQAQVAAAGLDNFIFKPYQPIEKLGLSLGVADVHWASLAPQLEGLIVPSKTYGVLAAGRPLLFIGAHDGEVGQLVTDNDCGTTIAPGDIDAVVHWLRQLRDDREQLHQLGGNSRALYLREFAYGISLRKWRELLLACSTESAT